MYTHAYERFKANGFKYDISSLDTSGMTVMAELGKTELDKEIKVKFEKAGKYIVEIDFTSPLTSLAQIAISLNVNVAGACTFISKGTDGKVGKMKAHVSIMQGEQKLRFTSKADVQIEGVRFLL
jgi:hypothetical protein